MKHVIQRILEDWWVAKKGNTSRAAKSARYGKRMTRTKVGSWRQSQETKAKSHQYITSASLMAASEGSTDHSKHLQNINSALAVGASSGQFSWTNPKTKTKFVVGDVNTSGTPDLVIHKGGSSRPTSVLEIASGANKMWGSLNVSPGSTVQFPSGHIFDRLHRKGIFTGQHMQALQAAISGKPSPRVAHSTSIGKDGRHEMFAEVERHLRSQGVTHIMVGGRVFSTDHSTKGVLNFSHVVRKTHFTTAGSRGTKRISLRVSGLREPRTNTTVRGNEENYNETVANKGYGADPTSLI